MTLKSSNSMELMSYIGIWVIGLTLYYADKMIENPMQQIGHNVFGLVNFNFRLGRD